MSNNEMVNILPMIHLCVSNEIIEMDENKFPLLDEITLQDMSSACMEFEENILVFPYVRRTVDGSPYIDLYFYGIFEDETIGFNRIVMEYGKRLSQNVEENLMWLVENEDLLVCDYIFYSFIKQIQSLYDQIHFYDYLPQQIGEAIKAFYFSTHTNCLETLYKSGLNVIADNFNQIEGVNLIGGTPSRLIDNLPMRLLRILNNVDLVSNLYSETSREKALDVYKNFAGFINGNEFPSVMQWEYLKKVHKGDIEFNRGVYKELKEATFGGEFLINLYTKYLSLREAVRPYYVFKGIPKTYEIENCVIRLEKINSYINDKEDIDKKMVEISKKNSINFSDDKYFIRMPISFSQFVTESVSQHNCLLSYLDSVINGNTIIVFMRQKDNPNTSLVTIEIRNGEITEARGQSNRNVSPEELDFIDRFSLAQNLEFDPYKLIEEIEYMDEYKDFCLEYHQRRPLLELPLCSRKYTYEMWKELEASIMEESLKN